MSPRRVPKRRQERAPPAPCRKQRDCASIRLLKNTKERLMMRPFALLVVLSTVAAPAAAQDPAWRLSLDEVRAITGRVSAGRTLQPASWPNDARVAVLLSFDVDNQTPTLGS